MITEKQIKKEIRTFYKETQKRIKNNPYLDFHNIKFPDFELVKKGFKIEEALACYISLDFGFQLLTTFSREKLNDQNKKNLT